MKLAQNPKFIYFDIRNVLLHEIGRTDRRIAEHLSVSEEYFAYAQHMIYKQLYQSGYQKFLHRQTFEQEVQFFEMFYKQLCLYLHVSFNKSFIDELIDLKLNGIYELEPGALELLHTLYPRYPLGIISNGSSARRKYELKINNIITFFQIVILSFEVGVEKPDKQIFKIASSRAHIHPQDILFIDDRIAFLDGAVQAGISNVLHVQKKEKTDKYPSIRYLFELVPLLEEVRQRKYV